MQSDVYMNLVKQEFILFLLFLRKYDAFVTGGYSKCSSTFAASRSYYCLLGSAAYEIHTYIQRWHQVITAIANMTNGSGLNITFYRYILSFYFHLNDKILLLQYCEQSLPIFTYFTPPIIRIIQNV